MLIGEISIEISNTKKPYSKMESVCPWLGEQKGREQGESRGREQRGGKILKCFLPLASWGGRRELVRRFESKALVTLQQ